jgi:hypothetical protein
MALTIWTPEGNHAQSAGQTHQNPTWYIVSRRNLCCIKCLNVYVKLIGSVEFSWVHYIHFI